MRTSLQVICSIGLRLSQGPLAAITFFARRCNHPTKLPQKRHLTTEQFLGATVLGQANLTDGTGSITITPAAAGTETITLHDVDDSDDQSSTGTYNLTVATATPTVTWATPAEIVVGTALSAAQLDASASFDGSPLAGTLIYSPAQGALLPVGDDRLTVTFYPTDSTDSNSVTKSVFITVAPASQPIAGGSVQPRAGIRPVDAAFTPAVPGPALAQGLRTTFSCVFEGF